MMMAKDRYMLQCDCLALASYDQICEITLTKSYYPCVSF